MSVVILGGNECMVRQYMDICDTFSCKAKVYPKMSACMKKIPYRAAGTGRLFCARRERPSGTGG